MDFISLHSNFDKEVTMAGTSLKRKARKNRVTAKKRVDNIKRLQQKPVIKNVDVEELKAQFEKSDKKPAAKKEEKEEKTAKGAKAEAKKEEGPVAKKAAPKKKAATKKSEEEPKAEKSEKKNEEK